MGTGIVGQWSFCPLLGVGTGNPRCVLANLATTGPSQAGSDKKQAFPWKRPPTGIWSLVFLAVVVIVRRQLGFVEQDVLGDEALKAKCDHIIADNLRLSIK